MSLKKRVALGVAVLVAVALAYLLLAPVPITPGAWTPPVAPTLTGQYQQNTRLTPVQRLSLGGGHKPEDVSTISTLLPMGRSTSLRRRTSFRCRSLPTTCSSISQTAGCWR